MSHLKKNIVANLCGNIWQAIMAFAFIPFYIKVMGVEAYGIVGIFFTLQTLSFLLDIRLSATLTREIARLSVLHGKKQEMRDLVRSLEIICWCIAIFIGFFIIAIAPFIAHFWVQPGKLSPQTIERALRIVGCVLAFQFPVAFYSGSLMGLQRQVLLNIINSAISTFRGAGAAMILWWISPTIQAFFIRYCFASILNTFLLAFFLWNRLPDTHKGGAFQKQLLAKIWRFAAGMSLISILATILTQLDKIILSKLLPLEDFGYYALAGVVAMSLYRLIGPIFSAVYPRFTQLVSLVDRDGLKQLYHESSQLMSVLILPVAVVIALFSHEIVLIWTQNQTAAENSYVLVSILISGTALNGLMNIPYGLQLAHGWTGLAITANVVAMILLVPTIVLMTIQYGVLGGASVWTILNAGYVLICIHFMHKRLLPGEKWNWYWQDISLPLIASIIIAGLGRILLHGQLSQISTVCCLLIILILTLLATAIVTPKTRIWLIDTFSEIKIIHRNFA